MGVLEQASPWKISAVKRNAHVSVGSARKTNPPRATTKA